MIDRTVFWINCALVGLGLGVMVYALLVGMTLAAMAMGVVVAYGVHLGLSMWKYV